MSNRNRYLELITRTLPAGLVVLIVAGSLQAQATRKMPDNPDLQTRLDAETVMRIADRAEERAAVGWVQMHRLPKRIRQADGRVIELVGLVNGRPQYLTSHNRMAARTTHTDALHLGGTLGLDLAGQGMEIAIWDAGHVRVDHQEFEGRIIEGDGAAPDDHATHVGGTLAAAGVDPEARGMAYEATLRTFDWNDDTSEMIRTARQQDLLVSNHSYGPVTGWEFADLENTGDQWYWTGDISLSTDEDADFGRYNNDAERWDFLAFNNPYLLPVVSAGNDRNDRGPATGNYRAQDPATNAWRTYTLVQQPIPPDGGTEGFDTISGHAVAKNVLTVGSIADRPDRGTSASVSSFSCFGPIDDGRVKPDLVANGEGLFSPISTGTQDYGRLSGTSMSTPNAAGSLLLLQQYYEQLTGQYMRAATLKGLVIHTAEDIQEPGPDYRHGWGVLDVEAAALQIGDLFRNQLAVYEGELPDQATFVRPTVLAEAGPIRITLSWTDPRGFVLNPVSLDDRRSRLINDLDVRLIHDATGNVYEPFVLDPDQPGRPAEAGDNVVDPVEQILVPFAEAGAYSIVVSHKGVLRDTNLQRFSLLVSGAVDEVRLVSLTTFDTEITGAGVGLQWQTGFEVETGTFVIERASVGFDADSNQVAGAFAEIGRTASGGPSQQPTAYTFLDESIQPGRFQYRLQFESASGTQYLGDIISVDVPGAAVSGITFEATLDNVALMWNVDFAFSGGTFVIERAAVNPNATLDDPVPVGEVDLQGPTREFVSYTFDDPFVPSGGYQYMLSLVMDDGTVAELARIEVQVPLPEELMLVSAYPNPFQDRAHILLDIPTNMRVTVDVYDAAGRRMHRLVDDERLSASRYAFELDTASWPPGLYLIRILTPQGTIARPVMLVR